MKKINEEVIKLWLSSKKNDRLKAVEEAVYILLNEYLQKYPNIIPIELHRLASIHKSSIVRLKNIKGDAFLMPSDKGFRILIKHDILSSKYRSSVAHELVHTLFYHHTESGQQKRIVPFSKKEENFCFDVARLLLAPKEHLEKIKLFNERDSKIIFLKLVNKLKMSRLWAARLMLADYKLAVGVADRWIKEQKGWKLVKGSSTATPELSQEERKALRNSAKNYLEGKEINDMNHTIFSFKEYSADGVFVVVTIDTIKS